MGRFAYNNRVGVLPILAVAAFAVGLSLIAFPLLSLLLRASQGVFTNSVASSAVLHSLMLSLATATLTTFIAVAVGTPISYINARYSYRGKELIDTLFNLPLVMPPAVAGIALLMAFGRRGVIGGYLDQYGVHLAFSLAAVVMAQLFVSSPFYIRQARTSFEDVDRVYENAAATLGASGTKILRHITLPIAFNGLVAGAVMTWARALGEFGATIMFAGNLEGRTQTMPLAIYTTMQSDVNASLTISLILITISFIVMTMVKTLTGKVKKDA